MCSKAWEAKNVLFVCSSPVQYSEMQPIIQEEKEFFPLRGCPRISSRISVLEALRSTSGDHSERGRRVRQGSDVG